MAIMIARGESTHTVPLWVSELESFRRWVHSDEYPEQAKALYFDGNIFLDELMEKQLHGEIKGAIYAAIRHWSNQHIPGVIHIDKMRYTNEAAHVSAEPDVMFLSDDSIESEEVTIDDGDDTLEIGGSPDLLVEIISPSSFQKDHTILMRKYWEAGVKEYWLADSRKAPSLVIHKRNGKRFTPMPVDTQGWQRSNVLGAKCRLMTKPGKAGITKVTLELKPLK
jgi:Uma2 family endonuclease